MLTRLEIANFRCFRALTVEPLKRINLICGKNNSGKTALLEALFALSGSPSGHYNLLQLPDTFRARSPNLSEEDTSWLFYSKDDRTPLKITGWRGKVPVCIAAQNKSQEMALCVGSEVFPDAPSLDFGSQWVLKATETKLKMTVSSTQPSRPEQDMLYFNQAIKKRKKDRITKMMTQVEPRLLSIEALQMTEQGRQVLYADMGLSEMIPMTHLGQGCGRLLNIYAEILAADADVLLIDEVENGLHHSVLPTVWKGLDIAAKETGVQIFATTHSWECILAANEAIPDDADFQVIRLDHVADGIKPTIMDKETISAAKEFDMEMR
jgi:AAA15 family ATPase/GTPase